MNEKHIELINSTINRMASNCFIVKGWCITLVAALWAISATNDRSTIYLLAYIPTVLFGLLDAYFLWLERRYVNLHEETIIANSTVPQFTMDTNWYRSTKGGYWGALWSWTVSPFDGALTLSILLVGVSIK